jgi:hypothetical protein
MARIRVLVLLVAVASTAGAITPVEIDEAAAHAHDGLRSVVRKLAGRKLAGRDNGTPGSVAAQRCLVRRLRRLGRGLNASGSGDTAYEQDFTYLGQTGTNLVAVMPGGDLASEYVRIGHYDHRDSRSDATGHCFANGAVGGEICNGAADNASGVAATLAIAKAIKKIGPPWRSVILALWDADEDLLNGSGYDTANPLVPNAAVKGYIKFDIRDADLLPSVESVSFAVGAGTGGAALVADGEAAFDSTDVGARLQASIDTVNALRRVRCQKL